MFRSQDGGINWVKLPNIATGQREPTDVAAGTTCERPALNGFIRHLPSPQIAISTDAGGTTRLRHSRRVPLRFRWNRSRRFQRLLPAIGKRRPTWSAEVRLNDDTTTTDQYYPALDVTPTGTAVASWYDRRLDPTANLRFDRFAASSTNSGVTWSANQRVSDVSSPVADTLNQIFSPCYHGDYDQVAITGDVGHIVWSDIGVSPPWARTRTSTMTGSSSAAAATPRPRRSPSSPPTSRRRSAARSTSEQRRPATPVG